jgi:hypothetical protein
MKYFLFPFALLFSIYVLAQDCSTESLLKKSGVWKEKSKGSEGGTATELLKEKKTIAAIHAMIKANYTPIGVQANFGGVYDRPDANMTGNGYYYRIIPLDFYCDGNNIKTAEETSSFFQVAANMFDAEIYDTAQGDRLLLEGFNVLLDQPVLKDGYWFFKEINVSLGMGITGKKSMWLITYDGKLPYAYVSRKEFLEKRIKAITALQNMNAGGYKDALKNLDIEKSFKEKEINGDAAKMSDYMKKDYLPRKSKYEKQLADNDKIYAPAFASISNQLKMPATELSQPAIVKPDPNSTFNYLFTTDDDPLGKNLIKPNPSYFNKKLTRSTPQFFMVLVTADDKEPIAAKFMSDIIKAVDFNLLKNMLGK